MTDEAVVVRNARGDELDAAGDVVVAAYLTLPGVVAGDPYLSRVRDARRRAATCDVLVAVDPDGRLLGCVTFVPGVGNPWAEVEREDEASFRMLGVAPAARGRGVGEALVRACLERAAAAGRSGVALSTKEEWAAARRLYERLGFRRDPDRDFDPVPGVHLIVYAATL